MVAKTIAQLMEEARIRAGAQNYKGYDYMDFAGLTRIPGT